MFAAGATVMRVNDRLARAGAGRSGDRAARRRGAGPAYLPARPRSLCSFSSLCQWGYAPASGPPGPAWAWCPAPIWASPRAACSRMRPSRALRPAYAGTPWACQ